MNFTVSNIVPPHLLKLPAKALNGHERVLYGSLHGNPELVLLLTQPHGNPFHDLWEFAQDLQGDVPAGSRDFRIGDHPVGADQPEKECAMEYEARLTSELDTEIPGMNRSRLVEKRRRASRSWASRCSYQDDRVFYLSGKSCNIGMRTGVGGKRNGKIGPDNDQP